jgi:urea transport system substrate-binding protein
VQYEGLERSPNIVYTGAVPNQQITPAVKWCISNLGKRFFLVGSDYVFPRTANAIIKDQVAALRGEIVGEEYVPLGGTDFTAVVRRIAEARPEVILNTINGDSNVAFFQQLSAAGVTAADIPTMSFSIAEEELRTLGVRHMVGNYACWNYFQSIDSPENRAFVKNFRSRYGRDRVVGDPMEAAYFGVYLWAQSAERAGTPDAVRVRASVPGQSFDAPEGLVHIDGDNNHTWKCVRVGRIEDDGQFEIVWDSGRPVRPIPYLAYRSKPEWDGFLKDLYLTWNGSWANPGEQ